MATFQTEETVICSITVKDSSGNLQNAATSMTISIRDSLNKVVVDAVAMTNDSTGTYHYDYTTTSTSYQGLYTIKYKATDGTRITIQEDTFQLE